MSKRSLKLSEKELRKEMERIREMLTREEEMEKQLQEFEEEALEKILRDESEHFYIPIPSRRSKIKACNLNWVEYLELDKIKDPNEKIFELVYRMLKKANPKLKREELRKKMRGRTFVEIATACMLKAGFFEWMSGR